MSSPGRAFLAVLLSVALSPLVWSAGLLARLGEWLREGVDYREVGPR